MTRPNPQPTFIILAKAARPGHVKTRLTHPPTHPPAHPPPHADDSPAAPLTPSQAAQIHAALFDAVLERITTFARSHEADVLLAMDDPAAAPPLATQRRTPLTDQGTGNLGDRLLHVWKKIAQGPAIFLGTDSPDLPTTHLRAALHAARTHHPHAAIGPVPDGGYWALAAPRAQPALLHRIDWGTPAVYDQTHHAARNAGLALADLPPWHDVDTPHDLAQLQQRLTQPTPAQDPALQQLADQLRQITHPMNDAPTNTAPHADADPLAEETRPSSGASGASSTPSNILIVDDNEQNVELLQAYLETLPGCHITTAGDGIKALQLIDHAGNDLPDAPPLPDLILLDVMMPRMSGFEVCQRLKDNPKTAAIPIMMVTALNELGDIERAVEAGTDDFLTKPVNKLELITRVKSLLRVRHLKAELDRTQAYIQQLEQRKDA